MDEERFNELKQFIAAMVSQAEARIAARIDGVDAGVGRLEHRMGGLERRLEVLQRKLDDQLAGIGEVIEQLNGRLNDRDDKVDRRFAGLERRIAARKAG